MLTFHYKENILLKNREYIIIQYYANRNTRNYMGLHCYRQHNIKYFNFRLIAWIKRLRAHFFFFFVNNESSMSEEF